jgi:hypothetical protein
VNPCQNGGTCSNKGKGAFICQCQARFTGLKCEKQCKLPDKQTNMSNTVPLIVGLFQLLVTIIHVLTMVYARHSMRPSFSASVPPISLVSVVKLQFRVRCVLR